MGNKGTGQTTGIPMQKVSQHFGSRQISNDSGFLVKYSVT
jgi:hypothetical protein